MLLGSSYGCTNSGGTNGGILIRHPNVYQLLRIQTNRTDKLREFLTLSAKNFHNTEARHDAVAGLLKIAENNMAGLLAAETIFVFIHARIDVFVAHVGLFVGKSRVLEGFEQPKVAHNGGDNRLLCKTAIFIQIAAAYIQDEIAVNHMAAFVNRKTTVGISVVGKTHVKPILHDKALQLIDVRGAAVYVDVQAVRGIVNDVRFCAQCVKNRASNT